MALFDKILSRFNLSSNREKVLKNVYWAVIGKIINILSALFVGILVARYLGPKNFGVMNYVISYVMLFSVFASFGLDNIEIRELSKPNAKKNVLLGTAFSIRLFFALLTIVLIYLTLLKFESDSFTFSMVMVYSISLIFSAFNVIKNYFTSIILNEYVIKTEISRTIIGAGIKIILLLNHCSLAWFIAATTFDFVLIGGGYIYSYRKKIGSIFAWCFNFSVAKMLLRESFPMLLSGTAVIIYQKINAIMIRNMMDDASLGQFSVAERLAGLAVFIPIVIAQAVTPLLVKAHQENKEQYYLKRQQFMDIMVWFSICMAIGFSLFASPAIRILFGEKYIQAIPVLQIMSWRAVAIALFVSSGQLILVEHLQKYAVLRNLIGCVVSVGLNYLFIPWWGVVGSAFATIITMLFSGYIAHLFIKPYRHMIPIQTKALLFGWKQIFHLFTLRK